MPKPKMPSPTMAVALLALFVALGGTAVAARTMITSTKQIRNGVVKRSDLANNAVNSSKVANGSIVLDDLQEATRAIIQNAGTQALEAFRLDGPQNVAAGVEQRVATLSNIPPGSYALFAKTVLTGNKATSGLLQQGGTIGGHCVLDAKGDADHARSLLGSPGANSPGELNMQMTRSFAETGEASVTCDVAGASWSATNTSIIAIRVGVSPRQVVEQ